MLVLLLVLTSLVHAQDNLDVRFLSTQRTTGTPLSIPIYISSSGELSLFTSSDSKDLSFNPRLQAGFSKATIEYSQPVVINRFNFYPLQRNLGWIEVKRSRIEAGAGIAGALKKTLTVGLVPYKGAMQTIVRHKASKEEKSLAFKMPRELADLDQWNEGDYGTFQTYGGIQVFAGVKNGIIDLASISMGIQNQFVIEMKKISEDEIELNLAEENLKRRQLVVGPIISDLALADFKGKRLITSFKLNIRDNRHHNLFKAGINGNIKLLQQELPFESQRITWEGSDRSFFIGIPAVVGKQNTSGHYVMDEDGVETELSIKGNRNKGFLRPLRNHVNYVYQNEKNIVIVWTSEMNKADEKAVEKNFFSKGRTMGVRGFDREIPEDEKFGSVVSQIGVGISQNEVHTLKFVNPEQIRELLLARCEKENLSCRKDGNLRKIMNKLKLLLAKPWDDMKGDFGLLLLKEPALIHSIVKSMKLKKDVYFKFLTEKYQSLEGSTSIEL